MKAIYLISLAFMFYIKHIHSYTFESLVNEAATSSFLSSTSRNEEIGNFINNAIYSTIKSEVENVEKSANVDNNTVSKNDNSFADVGIIGNKDLNVGNNYNITRDIWNVDNENDNMAKQLRAKRGVLHLYNVVSCATGCNPLIYKGYGCYCGFLGSGHPVDGIDSCCQFHDWCYHTAGCPMFFEYFIPYYWKCYYNRPICAIYHGEFGGPGSCAQRLCECDRVLAECLSHYKCPTRRAKCYSSPIRLLQSSLMLYLYP